MLCIVDETLIETVLHTNKAQDLHGPLITLKEPLVILHTDKHIQVLDTFLPFHTHRRNVCINLITQFQEVELILQIWLPLIKLSSYTLDFGLVYVGDTKKLTLIIENLSSIATFDNLFGN